MPQCLLTCWAAAWNFGRLGGRSQKCLWSLSMDKQNPIRCWLYSPKTNIAPENGPLEDEIPVGNHPFSGAMLLSGRVNLSEQYLSVAASCSHVFLKKHLHRKSHGHSSAKVLDDIATPSILRKEQKYSPTVEGKVAHFVESIYRSYILGGGFKYVLFSPLPREMIQFDEHIFQMGWWKNHQLDIILTRFEFTVGFLSVTH